MLVDDRGHAGDETKAPLPVELAAGPPGLVVPAVVDLAELGEDGLPVLPPHLEHRREVLQDEDLVRQAGEEGRVPSRSLEPRGEGLGRELGERVDTGAAVERAEGLRLRPPRRRHHEQPHGIAVEPMGEDGPREDREQCAIADEEPAPEDGLELYEAVREDLLRDVRPLVTSRFFGGRRPRPARLVERNQRGLVEGDLLLGERRDDPAPGALGGQVDPVAIADRGVRRDGQRYANLPAVEMGAHHLKDDRGLVLRLHLEPPAALDPHRGEGRHLGHLDGVV